MAKETKNLLRKLATMEQRRGTVKEFISEEFIDEQGNAIIDVNLEQDDNLFSPYSDKKVLNPEILNYIDSLADPIPANIPLIINFIVDDDSKLDQDFIKLAFKRHYWLSYKEKVRDSRRNLVTSLILFAIGFALLVIYYLLNKISDSFFGNEIILISSWVFIWEGVNRFFLDRREKKIDRINEGQMAVAMVTFENRSSKAALTKPK